MTIAENMAFVMGFPRRFGLIDWKKINQQAQEKHWILLVFSPFLLKLGFLT